LNDQANFTPGKSMPTTEAHERRDQFRTELKAA